jgi:uncharacterized protein (TIGR03437 family)
MLRFALLVLMTACSGQTQTISFLPPLVALTGGTSAAEYMCPQCMAIGDFNGDGKPDIAFSWMEFTPFAGVVLGNGDGTFGPANYFPVNQSSGAPFVGDFNGDGKQDIVMSSGWLYIGNGDGTFHVPLAIPGCTVALAADLNHDGKTDLICGTSVMLSNGDGTFRNVGTAGTFALETVVLSADFNNDGIPDLLLQEVSALQLAVVIGRGDGTFSSSKIIGSSSQLQVHPVIAGDFNGDGKIDLAGYGYRGFLIDVLPGNGDGTFGNAIQTDIAATNHVDGTGLNAADFNKDGRLDLIAGEAVFAGNGDGTFRFPVFFGPTTEACGYVLDSVLTPCNFMHVNTLIADFNGDGLPDLAAGDTLQGITPRTHTDITVLLNDSPGDGFTATGISSADYTSPVGSGSIVSAFGVNLAPNTAVATVNPAPTTLGGIRLHVSDRSHVGDWLAPLLYVSPTQINYVLNSSDPYAWVSIERIGSPFVPKGMAVPIDPIAPGFYSAVAIAVPARGQVTVMPITSIDLSGSPVYLSFYGTGFGAASAAASNCMAGTTALPITYVGPQLQIGGLDQANMLLPKSLMGVGSVNVVCNFGSTNMGYGITNPIPIFIR